MDKNILLLSDSNIGLVDRAVSRNISGCLGYKCQSISFWDYQTTPDSLDSETIVFIFLKPYVDHNGKTAEIKTESNGRDGLLKKSISEFSRLVSSIIIVCPPNLPAGLQDFCLGSLTILGSRRNQRVRLIDTMLSVAESHQNIYLLEHQTVFGDVGVNLDEYLNLKLTIESIYSWEQAKIASKAILDICKLREANMIKCVCVDLDNTLWGGAVGDVGIEGLELAGLTKRGKAFYEIQVFLKSLVSKGFFLVLVTKNFPQVVEEALTNLDSMHLTKNDFVLISCGWSAKSSRIKKVAELLNISESSILFLDDSPAERAEVSRNCQSVTVPDLSDNPVKMLHQILSLKELNKDFVTSEDRNRSKSIRRPLYDKLLNSDDFSVSLDGSLLDSSAEEVSLHFFNDLKNCFARVYQLLNKTNQFNLHGRRISEDELRTIYEQSNVTVLGKVSDSFSDYGLTVILFGRVFGSVLEISDFVMSCRIFNRKVEFAVVREALRLSFSVNPKLDRVSFAFVDTGRNKAIKQFLQRLVSDESYKEWGLVKEKIYFEIGGQE